MKIDVTRESFLGINSWSRYLLRPLPVTERHHIVSKFGNQGTLRTLDEEKGEVAREDEQRKTRRGKETKERGVGKGMEYSVRKAEREEYYPSKVSTN
jgi:hypothetical protein